MYWRHADLCVLVFDVNAATTFENLESWRDKFLHQAEPYDPRCFPFVIIGNKTDCGGRVVSQNEALDWSQSKGNIPFFECSAKDSLGVDEAFETVVRNALKYREDVAWDRENPH